MNWKIIFQLSVFGLIMAVGTISLIPEKIEPFFWLVIMLFSAWVIAKTCPDKYFLHGFLVGLANCFWITLTDILLYNTYISHHADMASMNNSMPDPIIHHPRIGMVLAYIVIGIASGLIIGLFSFIASKIVKKNPA